MFARAPTRLATVTCTKAGIARSLIRSQVHYFRVMRYVEANPLRAGLVSRAEDWQWSSLHERLHEWRLICAGPEHLPALEQWLEEVNRPMTPEEVAQARWRR